MSGITPLIDTLLHQVLGKRADVPAPKPLNQPIKPTAPSEAPKAVHSDSRLDARAPSPSAGEVARGASRGAPAQAPASPDAPLSASTHFSATARTIADLLVRFPAPPSAISPASPLMPAGEQSATPDQLAQRLAGSIRDSGLFYESHLARWYQGGLSRQQLNREPQMLQMLQQLRFTPSSSTASATTAAAGQASANAASAGAATAAASGGIEALAARVQALRPPVPFLAGGATARGGGAAPTPMPMPGAGTHTLMPPAGPAMTGAMSAPAGGEASAATAQGRAPGDAGRVPMPPLAGGGEGGRVEAPREPLAEGLQHLVRHQLEMLATPHLRWEGDVWSGLFMALVVQLPQGRREGQPGGEDADGERRDESHGWRSELELDVAGLGPLTVSLWMREARLDIDLRVREETIQARLAPGLEALRRRLAGHGFDDVRLRLDIAAEGET